jgi:hypothetical protein
VADDRRGVGGGDFAGRFEELVDHRQVRGRVGGEGLRGGPDEIREDLDVARGRVQ